jgi:hypothetical protein
MTTIDEKLAQSILREIDTHLSQGVLPVHNGHLQNLSQEEDVLDYLLLMKKEGLISGDVVTKGAGSTPYRMTNIRLTYLGIRVLRS